MRTNNEALECHGVMAPCIGTYLESTSSKACETSASAFPMTLGSSEREAQTEQLSLCCLVANGWTGRARLSPLNPKMSHPTRRRSVESFVCLKYLL